MKILVTGGAGYIGSVLVPELLNAGYSVIVLDNFMYQQHSLLDCCSNQNFEIIRGDVRDQELVKNLMKGVDYIIPLACLVGAPICEQKPEEAKAINHDAIEVILKNRTNKQKIIFPTTNSGYGIGEDGIFCTEETELRPISLYGKLKVNIEKEILKSANSITLRLATVFGISLRMRLDLLVNDFTNKAINDKYIVLFESHFKRNFVHIKDVARAFLFCINNFEEMKNQPYNVGLSDANLSKLELCNAIKKQIPEFEILESEINEDPDKRNYIVSNDKIEKHGYKAIHTIEMGIIELLKGFKILKDNRYSNI